jgi:hypothetical protein
MKRIALSMRMKILRWKRVQGNSPPPQDLLVYDSMSHLVPILSDLTLPAARFFTSPAQNNPMGISSGFAPARENSLTQAKACQNTSPRQIIGNLSIPYRLVAGSQQWAFTKKRSPTIPASEVSGYWHTISMCDSNVSNLQIPGEAQDQWGIQSHD